MTLAPHNLLIDEITWKPATDSAPAAESGYLRDPIEVIIGTVVAAAFAAALVSVPVFFLTATGVAVALTEPGDHGGGFIAGGLIGSLAAAAAGLTAYIGAAWWSASKLAPAGDRTMPMIIAVALPAIALAVLGLS